MRAVYPIAVLLLAGVLLACQQQERRSDEFPSPAPDDTSLVAVDASVYRGLMEMLGIGDRCIDFSGNMKIGTEQLAASGAGILMLSVYDGVDTEKYRRTGIRIVECTDFNEPSALRRAEWMVRYGAVLGVQSRADSLYHTVVTRYDSLRACVKKQDSRPTVMFDLVYGNIWYQPVKDSSTGSVIADAGGELISPAGGKNGAAAFTKEQMLMKSAGADVWIIRYSSTETLTLAALKELDPAYRHFKAFRKGNVWACNTSQTNYFEEAPFRPDYLLEDVLHILYGEGDTATSRLHYFEKLK